MVRQHLAASRAKYALVVRSESDTEVWWAGDSAGISVAAAIETWLDGAEADVPEFRMVIPLDAGIYTALVKNRLVVEERILPPARAEEELREWTGLGTVVYAYGWGGLKSVVERHVPLEPLPFDPLDYAYSPAWKVLGRNFMVHPVHVLAAAAVAAAFFGFTAAAPLVERYAQMGWNLASHWLPFGEGEDALIRNAPPTVVTPKVDHSAASHMRALAGVLAGIEVLYRDGLSSLAFSGGAVTLAGSRPGTCPGDRFKLVVLSLGLVDRPDRAGRSGPAHPRTGIRAERHPAAGTDGAGPAVGSGGRQRSCEPAREHRHPHPAAEHLPD